ncbi:MAG: hypothetical protein HGB17_18680 [Syntrophobacteraceae bacterium]|nr:hypothetical protein [Syntrophobacteraceae bacterium]
MTAERCGPYPLRYSRGSTALLILPQRAYFPFKRKWGGVPDLPSSAGEITLRGMVLPVGGIKEKVLAAHRAGIKTIVLPKWNQKDLVDVPPKVQREIAFHFVDEMLDVLKIALVKA